MKDQRIGKFQVAGPFVDLDNLGMRRLMERAVILQVEYSYRNDRYEYTALCEDFEVCPSHRVVPEYDVLFSGDPVQVRFEKRSRGDQ